MFNAFLHKINDITHLHKRAAFSDLEKVIAAKESVFQAIARERYSCRAFKATPLTDVQVNHILEAGRLAPTAKNQQPVHVWVVKSPEAIAKLNNASGSIYGAPAVFIVGCKPEDAWVRKYDGKNAAEVDAAIVGTHMMLEASALGLGNVWVGSFDPERIKADFPETAGYEIVSLLPVGVPAAEPGPRHAERKALADFASEL